MWKLEIRRVDNGYLIRYPSEDNPKFIVEKVLEETEDDLTYHESLLWEIIDYFNFGGSKWDKERIRIIREKGEDYEKTEETDDTKGNPTDF